MKRLLIFIAIITAALLPSLLWQPLALGLPDYMTQEVPFIIETRRMLLSGQFPLWSWNSFLGASFIPTYGFYTLGSPFVWLQCLVPASLIMASFIPILYLKLICMAAAMRLYLKRMEISDTYASLGGMLYALSSFSLANLFYWHFAEPMIMMPLLLWALEGVIRGQHKRYPWLIIISFGVMLVNFYFASASFIGALIYMLFRLPGRQKWGLILLRCFGCIITGIAMAAPVFVPAMLQLIQTARAEPSLQTFYYTYFWYDTKLLLSFFFPVLSDGACTEFCSSNFQSHAAWLPFVASLGAAGYILNNRRSRLSWLLLLLLILYTVMPLGGIFNFFTNIEYSRWAYILILIAILAAMRYLDQGGRIPLKYAYKLSDATILLGVLATMILSGRNYYMISIYDKFNINTWLIIALVALNCIAAFIWIYFKCSRKSTIWLTLFMCWAFTTCSLMAHLHADDIGGTWYDSFDWNQTENHVDGKLNDFHSRVMNDTPVENYALLTGEPSFVGYNSIGPNSVVDFYLMYSGGIGNYPGHIIYIYPYSNAALLSCREIVTFRPKEWQRFNYKLLSHKNQLYRFSNKRYLPMGFAYDSYITKDELKQLQDSTPRDIGAMLLDNIVLRSEKEPAARLLRHADISRISLIDDSQRLQLQIDSLVAARSRFTATDFRGTATGWSCRTNLPEPKMLFFSIPAEPGFTYYLDGREIHPHITAIGMPLISVPAGEHHLEARFIPPGLIPALWIAAAALLILLALIFIASRRLGVGLEAYDPGPGRPRRSIQKNSC